MLDENKHIDSLFADGLKGMSVEPNPEVWNAISGNMAAARRKRRGVIIFISTALAASVLLFLSIANRDLFTTEPGSLQIEQFSDNSSSSNTSNIQGKIAETDNKIEEEASDEVIEKNDLEFIVSNKVISTINTEDIKSASIDDNFSRESLINSRPISIGELFNSKNEIPESIQYQSADKLEPIKLTTEEMIVMNNLLAMEQATKDNLRKNRWAIIGQFTSAYSNEESAASANSGIISYGGGVKVNYALGEKLALQTGFMYNSFGQDIGGGGSSLLFSDANAVEGDPTEGLSQTRKVLPSNTTAGNIKYTGVAKDANSEYMVAGTYSSSEDLMQSFETIEVPFLLRYTLSQKRLGVYMSGGFGANWIVNNGVYRNSGSKEKVGEIDNLRTTNFSSQFGLGFEYNLSPKIQIGLEPSFKYYLNSINKSSQFNYKPYSIGIHTGIRYNF